MSAIGSCALMTAHFGSFVSSTAQGTILKFAAIGVINVPQYPAVIPSTPITAGFPPCEMTNGTPIPAVMTVKAANAFPIIIVKMTMPNTYMITPTTMFPCGTTEEIMPEITSPTPASANTLPSAPRSCGKRQAAPTCIRSREVSSFVSEIFGLQIANARISAMIQATPVIIAPFNAVGVATPSFITSYLTKESINAIRPTVTAGRKILVPILSLAACRNCGVDSSNFPIFTCPVTVRHPIMINMPPTAAEGSALPNMKMMPVSVQKRIVPTLADSFFPARYAVTKQTSPQRT